MENLKIALGITLRPFSGFWDLKYEKKGKLKVAFLIIIGVALTMIFERRVSAFLFNPYRKLPVNLISTFRNVIGPYILFCVANWSVTTLMDGEGKMSDIFMAVGYAMLPMILIRIPLAILTNVLTFDEAAMVTFLKNIATFWSYFLVFSGIMTVHQYGMFKTLVTLFLTLVACGVMIFIAILFYNLLWQLVGFVGTIYTELLLRF
ncbi:MAG TPA: YIP1 family protein [Clostridiales bacterium]|nr:YIP1 family protein [Clostridiales bacterium]